MACGTRPELKLGSTILWLRDPGQFHRLLEGKVGSRCQAPKPLGGALRNPEKLLSNHTFPREMVCMSVSKSHLRKSAFFTVTHVCQ